MVSHMKILYFVLPSYIFLVLIQELILKFSLPQVAHNSHYHQIRQSKNQRKIAQKVLLSKEFLALFFHLLYHILLKTLDNFLLQILHKIVTIQYPVKGTLIFRQNRENKISVSPLLQCKKWITFQYDCQVFLVCG